MRFRHAFALILSAGIFACQPDSPPAQPAAPAYQAISLLGDTLVPAPPSDALLEKLAQREQAYETDTTDLDALIWYGRFLAYAGDYRAAIKLYTLGLKRWPQEPHLLRHRGHRYLSIREFDRAIADFEAAVTTMEDMPLETEPDGMPNAQNIPVSTLQGNVWYHLGLAYYLTGDFPNALRCYTQCLQTTPNDDNVVSATHWLYMINRRLGDTTAAKMALEFIRESMDVIENFDYHRACRFYQGEIGEEELLGTETDSPGSDAVRYALANWQLYHGDTTTAEAQFRELLATGSWNSFGYIAAEADVARLAGERETGNGDQ
ncbi:MAG: tetratricopeptide repeat protein [Lewinella sp.]|nr:tetratricopeptide repeat protein [Lewinella sp.]